MILPYVIVEECSSLKITQHRPVCGIFDRLILRSSGILESQGWTSKEVHWGHAQGMQRIAHVTCPSLG